MEIIRLKKEDYEGKRFTASYTTGGYYDICPVDSGFLIKYVPLETPEQKTIDDVFFGEWPEAPTALGAFEDGRLTGFAEGSMESRNNRFRISNICVFDGENRGKGIGRALMEAIIKEAEAAGARMAVPETQSCNEGAIAFHKKCGFEIIGFDLYAYTDTDPERREVRMEMGKS